MKLSLLFLGPRHHSRWTNVGSLYLLARHPHIQQQVHEEVDKFFGECLAYGVQGHFAQTPFFVFVLFTRTTKCKLSYDIHAMEKILFMLHLDFSSQCTVTIRDFVNTGVRMNAFLFTYS